MTVNVPTQSLRQICSLRSGNMECTDRGT